MKNIFYSALLLLVLGSCSSGTEQPKTDAKETAASDRVIITAEQARVTGLETGTFIQKNLREVLKVNGKLDVPPQNFISISCPVGGYIKDIQVYEGDHVKKGQVLAMLEHPDLAELQQRYVEAVSRQELLEKAYKRQAGLRQEDVNAAKKYEQAMADYQIAKAQAAAIGAKLDMLGLSRQSILKGNISSRVALRAPANAYVTAIHANNGKYAAPQDEIFELVNTDHIHVELYIFEKDINKVQEGQPVHFNLSNDASREYTAKVHLVGHEIGPDRTIKVHCHLDKESPGLLPGMYVDARIEVSASKENALPEDAIVRSGENDFIFIKSQDSTFRMVQVKRGISDAGFTEVTPLQKLPEGTPVVVKGAFFLLSQKKLAEDGGEE